MTVDIDFLPVTFREAGLQRKNFTLRVSIVGVFAVMILFAILYQQHLRSMSQNQLSGMVPQYLQAEMEAKHLSDLQRRVRTAEKQAELCAYLQHPWPRSRILAEIAAALPDEIELDRLDIAREQLPVAPEQGRPEGTGQTASAAADAKAKLEPAEHDLQGLRDEWDNKTQVVVTIVGITSDPAAMHQYLERLNQIVLFTKVDLHTVEQIAGDSTGRMRFVARLIVKRGYVDPNGPRPGENVTEREMLKVSAN